MKTIKLNDKEYKIKFGYEATVKNGIIKKLVQIENAKETDTVDEILLFLPELLLVGLQKFHSDEFGFDPCNKEEKEKQLEKVYSMIDDYLDLEDADFGELYEKLTAELVDESFLASMLNRERGKVRKAATKK